MAVVLGPEYNGGGHIDSHYIAIGLPIREHVHFPTGHSLAAHGSGGDT